MAGWSESHLQEEGGQSGFGIGPQKERLGRSSLLSHAYGLYRRRFWIFFRIAFLPGLLAYLFSQASRFWIRPRLQPLLLQWLTPQLSLHDLRSLHAAPWYSFFVNPGTVLAFLDGIAYWFLSAFLFAAVATEILGGEKGPEIPRDAYTRARERIAPVFVVSLLVWTCFTACRLVARFAVWKIAIRFSMRPLAGNALFILPTVLLCGLLSRLGLAIPGLMDDSPRPLSAAVRASVFRTENWEPFFMIFVVKSAIAGYALYWLANHALDWLVAREILSATLDPWVSRVVYISIAGAIETPLFIAFSLLFRDFQSYPEG